MTKYYIYKVEDCSGKVYIGSTNDKSKRKYDHIRRPKYPVSIMCKNSKEFEVIQTLTTNKLFMVHLLEQTYIDLYRYQENKTCLNKSNPFDNNDIVCDICYHNYRSERSFHKHYSIKHF